MIIRSVSYKFISVHEYNTLKLLIFFFSSFKLDDDIIFVVHFPDKALARESNVSDENLLTRSTPVIVRDLISDYDTVHLYNNSISSEIYLSADSRTPTPKAMRGQRVEVDCNKTKYLYVPPYLGRTRTVPCNYSHVEMAVSRLKKLPKTFF